MKRGPETKALLAGAAFALLYPLGTPGYGVPGLAFVCLVPLVFLALGAPNSRGAFTRCLLAGAAADVLLYYWIGYTVAVKGNLGWAAGSVAALLVGAYVAVYIGAAGWFAHRLFRQFSPAGLYALPAVWVFLEFARSILVTGFPWMSLGYAVADNLYLRQAADLAGVPGLSFLLVLSNVFAAQAALRLGEGNRRGALRPLAGLLAVPAALFAYGLFAAGAAPGGDAPLRVGIAQGGIDQSVKWDPAFQRATLSIYDELTREAAGRGAQVIVWPETAAPFMYGWERALSAEVDNIAASRGVPLVFGAPWYDPAEGGRYFNSVFLLDGRGVPLARYDKRHLVPFGEYIPLKEALFFLRKLAASAGDFSPGGGATTFAVGGTRAGVTVCYEAIFPAILRGSVEEGAGWFVNVTNDAWFGDTVAPRQHLAMARVRCVEFRRPMVRAANAGISAFIDARGEFGGTIGLFRRGTAVEEIRPSRGSTVYAKSGDIFAVSCTIMTVLTFLIPLRGGHGHRTARGKKVGARKTPGSPPGLPLK